MEVIVQIIFLLVLEMIQNYIIQEITVTLNILVQVISMLMLILATPLLLLEKNQKLLYKEHIMDQWIYSIMDRRNLRHDQMEH